jgi:hypothetical protein
VWRPQRDLQDNFAFLRQKICLMALIEAVFKRPTTDRVLPFSVIAAETRIPANEVEHLVMKALSLKLIRGTLDQVASTTAISWVQPRVLDKTQIDGLRGRLTEWTEKVTAGESVVLTCGGCEGRVALTRGWVVSQWASSRRCRRPSCLCRKDGPPSLQSRPAHNAVPVRARGSPSEPTRSASRATSRPARSATGAPDSKPSADATKRAFLLST